jgi:hypothetical protein
MSAINTARMQGAMRRRAMERGRYQPRVDGYVENFRLAFDETTEFESLSSEGRLRQRAEDYDAARLRDLRERGDIPEDIWNSAKRRDGVDWTALKRYANDELGEDFSMDWKQNAMVQAAVRESNTRRDLMDKTPLFSMGGLGQIAGTGLAYFNPRQPLDFALTVGAALTGGLGAGTVVGRTVAGTALRTMARTVAVEGAVAGVEESVRQVKLYELRNKLGQEYRLSEAAANVLGTMLFSSLIGGAISGVRAPGAHREAKRMRDEALVRADKNAMVEALTALRDRFNRIRVERGNVMDANVRPLVEDPQRAIREVMDFARGELEPIARKRLNPLERRALEEEIQKVEQLIRGTRADFLDPIDPQGRDLSPKQRREEERRRKRAERTARRDRKRLETQLGDLKRVLNDHLEAVKARTDMNNIENGIVPPQYQKIVDEELRMLRTMGPPKPGSEAFGPRDPLTIEERVALEDVEDMIVYINTLDDTTSAADALRGLNEKFADMQRTMGLDEVVPQPRAADEATDALEGTARSGPAMVPAPGRLNDTQTAPPEVDQLAKTYEAERKFSTPDGEKTWEDMVAEARREGDTLLKQIDDFNRCRRG